MRFPLKYVNSDKFANFLVDGMGDHLLVQGESRWLLFFETDRKVPEEPPHFPYEYKAFPSTNGWHMIGLRTGSLKEKIDWYGRWKAVNYDSDYLLRRCNVIRPCSPAELRFILTVARSCGAMSVPRVRYYRDKAVFESYGEIIRHQQVIAA